MKTQNEFIEVVKLATSLPMLTKKAKKMNNSQLSKEIGTCKRKGVIPRNYLGRRDTESGAVVETPATILPADIKFVNLGDKE